MTAAQHLERLIRDIPDFPTSGVLFKDLTPVLVDAEALASIADALVEPFLGAFDVIAGVEARGFALAAAAAARHGSGVILVRKAGKLPGGTISQDYALEYGTATLEVHRDQVPVGSRVLIIDDVLATGGTIGAAATLAEQAGWHVAGIIVALELAHLGGRARLEPRPVSSLLTV